MDVCSLLLNASSTLAPLPVAAALPTTPSALAVALLSVGALLGALSLCLLQAFCRCCCGGGGGADLAPIITSATPVRSVRLPGDGERHAFGASATALGGAHAPHWHGARRDGADAVTLDGGPSSKDGYEPSSPTLTADLLYRSPPVLDSPLPVATHPQHHPQHPQHPQQQQQQPQEERREERRREERKRIRWDVGGPTDGQGSTHGYKRPCCTDHTASSSTCASSDPLLMPERSSSASAAVSSAATSAATSTEASAAASAATSAATGSAAPLVLRASALPEGHECSGLVTGIVVAVATQVSMDAVPGALMSKTALVADVVNVVSTGVDAGLGAVSTGAGSRLDGGKGGGEGGGECSESESLRSQVRRAITAFALGEGELRNLFESRGLAWDDALASRMVETTTSQVSISQEARGLNRYVLRRGDSKLDERRLGALRKYLSKCVEQTAVLQTPASVAGSASASGSALSIAGSASASGSAQQ